MIQAIAEIAALCVIAGNINEANDIFSRSIALLQLKEGDIFAFSLGCIWNGERSLLERSTQGMAYLASILAVLLLLARSLQAQSNHYRFWAGEIPPYSYLDGAHHGRGDLLRIFQTLVERMGYKNIVEIVPWKRVLMEAQKPLPIIFIPAARSPEREKLYHWIAPLIDESFGIFSLPSLEREIQDVERIKSMRICTLRGSVTEELARRHQLVRLELVATNDTCARLLKAGRVNAWLAAKRAAMASFTLVGYDMKNLKVGVQLEVWPLYVAASKGLSAAEVLRWRAEIQKMKADGTMDRLLN